MSEAHSKRRRHVPQGKGASHIYWSETAKGKVFEVRHPRNAEGKRLYEVVGPNLAEVKARARQIHEDSSGPMWTSQPTSSTSGTTSIGTAL